MVKCLNSVLFLAQEIFSLNSSQASLQKCKGISWFEILSDKILDGKLWRCKHFTQKINTNPDIFNVTNKSAFFHHPLQLLFGFYEPLQASQPRSGSPHFPGNIADLSSLALQSGFWWSVIRCLLRSLQIYSEALLDWPSGPSSYSANESGPMLRLGKNPSGFRTLSFHSDGTCCEQYFKNSSILSSRFSLHSQGFF